MRGKKYEFTVEQKEYIKTNWQIETPNSFRTKFGCSSHAIDKIAVELGLEKANSYYWTTEQKLQLQELAQNHPREKIAKLMNRSENSIFMEGKRLGIIFIHDRRKWQPTEEQILREQWGIKPIEKIAKQLNRTTTSLESKADRMNLGPKITNNLEILTIAAISELLNISRTKICRSWIKKQQLKVKKIHVTKNKSYLGVSLNDLITFLEEHQNEWDSRDLGKNMLGLEPDWLISKRKKDIEDNPLKYRIWTVAELKELKQLLLAGRKPEEIAPKINRTAFAIKKILKDEGNSYQSPRIWPEEEKEYIRDNYSHMTRTELAQALGRTKKSIESQLTRLGTTKTKRLEIGGNNGGK